jgi:hypothetical protein
MAMLLVVATVLSGLLTTSASNLRLHSVDAVDTNPLPPNATARLRRVERQVDSLETPTSPQNRTVEAVGPHSKPSTCIFLGGLTSAKLSTQCCKNAKVVTQNQLASYGLASVCEPDWQCEADKLTPTRQFQVKSLSSLCGEPGCLPAVVAAVEQTNVAKGRAESMAGICSTLGSLGGSNANPELVSKVLASGRMGKGGGSNHCSDEDREAGKCDDSGCFPFEANVIVEGGGPVPVGKVKKGDSVLASMDGHIRYEPVLGFLHRIPSRSFDYVTVFHEEGVFRATANHLIFIAFGRSWTSKLVGNLKVGDVIYAAVQSSDGWESKPSAVVKLHEESSTQLGVVAPFTSSGTLVIDGVVASNYASISKQKHLPHSLVHASFLPVRLYHDLGLAAAWQRFWNTADVEDEASEWMHPYVNKQLSLTRVLKLDKLLPVPLTQRGIPI